MGSLGWMTETCENKSETVCVIYWSVAKMMMTHPWWVINFDQHDTATQLWQPALNVDGYISI